MAAPGGAPSACKRRQWLPTSVQQPSAACRCMARAGLPRRPRVMTATTAETRAMNSQCHDPTGATRHTTSYTWLLSTARPGIPVDSRPRCLARIRCPARLPDSGQRTRMAHTTHAHTHTLAGGAICTRSQPARCPCGPSCSSRTPVRARGANGCRQLSPPEPVLPGQTLTFKSSRLTHRRGPWMGTLHRQGALTAPETV